MGGEKIKDLGKIMLLSLLLVVLISLAGVSAQDTNSTALDANHTDVVQSVDLNQSLSDGNAQDSVVNLTNDNIKSYFVRGNLNSMHAGKTFNITEDIEDLGVLNIKASDVTINGNNHTLKNTVFCIYYHANHVTLNNFTMNLTEAFDDNDGAAIEIYYSNGASIFNVNINYIAPRDSEAYGIYSMGQETNSGQSKKYNRDLKIVNCTINFKAGKDVDRAYAVKLEDSPGALFENNRIDASLPLRTVAFIGTTAVLDSEFALAVGISRCDDLVFNNNTINAEVGVRPECENPTLDAIFIADSKNCNFTNNTVSLRDDITFKDEVNYLYALDAYRTDNLLIENNKIRVETKGGTLMHGTAYPVQLTGPADGILIQLNDLYSKSNGPNIGIYSQNFNGESYITILNNYINITGLAGNHSWALVAGIEAQDDNDIIMNNIIEVHNIQKVSKDDNIYGISYSQSTDGSHSYRVVNNTVISDGYYLSHMLDADNTTVTNNTLVRTDKYADTNYDPFKRGAAIGEETDAAKHNYFSGNRVITIFEYGLEHQSNEIDGGEEFNYVPPENVNGYTNVINGSGIAPKKPGFPGGNPLIPGGDGTGAFNTGGGNAHGFSDPDRPDGGNGYNGWPDLSGDDGRSLSRKHNGNHDNVQNSFSNDGNSENAYSNVKGQNSSSTSPDVVGVADSGSSKTGSSSAGSAGSSGATQDIKAYEISKKITETGPDSIIKFLALAIVCEILLALGYRRRENEEY